MNINRALAVLAKKFSVNADIFKPLSKAKVVDWAKAVVAANEAEKRAGDGVNQFRLTRDQHAFLIGEIPTF